MGAVRQEMTSVGILTPMGLQGPGGGLHREKVVCAWMGANIPFFKIILMKFFSAFSWLQSLSNRITTPRFLLFEYRQQSFPFNT